MAWDPPQASLTSTTASDNGKGFHKILDDKLGDALLSIWAAYQDDTARLREDNAYLNKKVLLYSNGSKHKNDRELETLQHENAHLRQQLTVVQKRWPVISEFLLNMSPEVSSSEAMIPFKSTKDAEVLTDPVRFEEFDRQLSARATNLQNEHETTPARVSATSAAGFYHDEAPHLQQNASEKFYPGKSSPSQLPAASPQIARHTPPRRPRKGSAGIMPLPHGLYSGDIMSPGVPRSSSNIVVSQHSNQPPLRTNTNVDHAGDLADADEELRKRRERDMEDAHSKTLDQRENYVRKALRERSKNINQDHISRMMDLENDQVTGVVKILVGHIAHWMDKFYSLEEPERTGPLARLLNSSMFATLSNLAIMWSYGFVGYAANYRVKHYEDEEEGIIVFMGETIQYAYFTGEVLLKLIVHREFFFCNDYMGWNIWDLLLALFGTYDRYDRQYSDKVAFMRCLRMLKLAGVYLRNGWLMRWTPELRILLGGILRSSSAIVWSTVLLISVYYLFGVVFAQGAATYLYLNKDKETTALTLEILTKLHSVSACMLRLLESSTGGEDWATIYPLIEATGKVNAIFFIAFIAFVQIMVFNLLTGLFVDATLKGAEPDRETKALALRKQDLYAEADLLRIMKEIDRDGDNTIDLEEFSAYLRNEKFRSYLKLNGLDMTERDAKMIYRKVQDLLNIETDDVPTEAFLIECLKLKGDAKTLDLWRCIYMQQEIHNNLMSSLASVLELHYGVDQAPQLADTAADLNV